VPVNHSEVCTRSKSTRRCLGALVEKLGDGNGCKPRLAGLVHMRNSLRLIESMRICNQNYGTVCDIENLEEGRVARFSEELPALACLYKEDVTACLLVLSTT
jgi:hypothetical protein